MAASRHQIMADSLEKELFDQLFLTSQEDVSQQVHAACARSESGTFHHEEPGDSEEGVDSSESSPSLHRKTTCWWAPLIKGHVAEHASDPVHVKTVTVLSACAGCCAEAEVLRVTWLGN